MHNPKLQELIHIHPEINALHGWFGAPKTHFLLLPIYLQLHTKASEAEKHPGKSCDHIFPTGNLPFLKLVELLTSKYKQ